MRCVCERFVASYSRELAEVEYEISKTDGQPGFYLKHKRDLYRQAIDKVIKIHRAHRRLERHARN